MRLKSIQILLISTLCISIFSCRKIAENVLHTDSNDLSATLLNENDHMFGGSDDDSTYSYTTLGRKYGSVYNVENVKNAWNALSANRITTPAPTHRYIKFTPSSVEDLNKIVNSGIPL